MSIPYCLHKLINLFTWPLVLLQPISSFTDAVQYSPPSRCPLVIITFYLSTACCNLFTFTQTSLGIKHQTKISTMNIFRILRRSSFHFPPCFPPSWPHLGGWIWMRILCIHAHEPILRTHASFVRILERFRPHASRNELQCSVHSIILVVDTHYFDVSGTHSLDSSGAMPHQIQNQTYKINQK